MRRSEMICGPVLLSGTSASVESAILAGVPEVKRVDVVDGKDPGTAIIKTWQSGFRGFFRVSQAVCERIILDVGAGVLPMGVFAVIEPMGVLDRADRALEWIGDWWRRK